VVGPGPAARARRRDRVRQAAAVVSGGSVTTEADGRRGRSADTPRRAGAGSA
jgi:hypothetical protein